MKKLNLKLDDIKEMLTKEQMKKITGGYGYCSESCGPLGNVKTCSSAKGDCTRDNKHNPSQWISCDGTKTDCPSS